MSIREEIAVMAEEYGMSERTIMNYAQGVLERVKEEYSGACYDEEDILECLESIVSTCSSLQEETNKNGKRMTTQMIINDAVDSKFNRNYDYYDSLHNKMTDKEIEQYISELVMQEEKRITLN